MFHAHVEDSKTEQHRMDVKRKSTDYTVDQILTQCILSQLPVEVRSFFLYCGIAELSP